MNKPAAILAAIKTQLAKDGKPSVKTGAEVMQNDFKYDSVTIDNFLNGVAGLLEKDTPSYVLDVTKLDTDTCLADTVTELCGYMATVTS